MTRLIRVFPSKTRATPDDEWVRFGPPGMFDEADEIHVSVTFTWDKPRAEWLAEQWRRVAPVKIGGVAYRSASRAPNPGSIPGGPSLVIWAWPEISPTLPSVG